MKRLRVRLIQQPRSCQIEIDSNLLRRVGQLVRKSSDNQTNRVAIISNARVYNLFGTAVARSLSDEDYSVSCWLMPDGERFKTFRSLGRALHFLYASSLERQDVVLALGGGVVGDLAGFAAAVYMRGIDLVQIPTTLLAQIDSSVGGKTGINLPEGKNIVGAFHQPRLIAIDPGTLSTLPSRELTSGFCEMVKQGVIASSDLFEQTSAFLDTFNADPGALRSKKLEALIAAHCAFKASVVAIDERETASRTDSRSRRILNFGHTTAHALEVVTGYRRFRHGEAVGYGIGVAGEISKRLGLIGASELESMREAVRLCGPLPSADDLDEEAVMQALQRDKKSVGGRIKWVLLEGIGRPRIFNGEEISPRLLRTSLRAGLKNLKGG